MLFILLLSRVSAQLDGQKTENSELLTYFWQVASENTTPTMSERMVVRIWSSRWHQRTHRPVLNTAPTMKKASTGHFTTGLALWGSQSREEGGPITQYLATGSVAFSPWGGKQSASLLPRQWRLDLKRQKIPLQKDAQTRTFRLSALCLPLQPHGWRWTLDPGHRWTGSTMSTLTTMSTGEQGLHQVYKELGS